jgi:hypothetical protein
MRFRWISTGLAFLTIVVITPLAAEEPGAPAHLREAYLLWQEGYQLHLAGAYEEAIKRFRSIYRTSPDCRGAHVSRLVDELPRPPSRRISIADVRTRT